MMSNGMVARLHGADRLRNDGDGNPRFRLRLGDSVFETEPGAQVAFSVESHVGRDVAVAFNDAGRVVGLHEE